MKFKLDENMGHACIASLKEDGHDVATVYEQGLCGRPDREVINVCKSEDRCLVTMDVEFGNPLLFDPSKYPGIALVRLPSRPSERDLPQAIDSLREGVQRVIQPGRVRVYQQPDRDLP